MSQPPHRHRKAHNLPGHAHALTFSCYRGYPFLRGSKTCHWLAEAVNRAGADLGYSVLAYVFIPEHIHLVIFPKNRDDDIALFLRAVKQPVARRAVQYLLRYSPQWIPKITRTRGKRTERLFWQSGGGYDRNINEPQTLSKTIDYIHTNPVRRGLVPTATDWQWSSARWYAGMLDEKSL